MGDITAEQLQQDHGPEKVANRRWAIIDGAFILMNNAGKALGIDEIKPQPTNTEPKRESLEPNVAAAAPALGDLEPNQVQAATLPDADIRAAREAINDSFTLAA